MVSKNFIKIRKSIKPVNYISNVDNTNKKEKSIDYYFGKLNMAIYNDDYNTIFTLIKLLDADNHSDSIAI